MSAPHIYPEKKYTVCAKTVQIRNTVTVKYAVYKYIYIYNSYISKSHVAKISLF